MIARVLAISLAAAAAPARADIGFGFGFGFQNIGERETNFVNSWSLQNAAAAAANRPQPLTRPARQVRDEGFVDRYDPATREAIINRVARNPGRQMSTVGVRPSTTAARTPPPPPITSVPEPDPRPAMLLGNFFDRDRRLAWPVGVPSTGDLGQKQQLADRAILAVLNEYELQGLAHISNVTEARQRLLDYGRPALDLVRNQSTPVLADSFHAFLLSLHANLGHAATVPRTP